MHVIHQGMRINNRGLSNLLLSHVASFSHISYRNLYTTPPPPRGGARVLFFFVQRLLRGSYQGGGLNYNTDHKLEPFGFMMISNSRNVRQYHW